MRLLGLLSVLIIFAGCAHSIHDVYMSDAGDRYSSLESGKVVRGRAEQFVILGFVTETNYVDVAKNQLIAQCPTGEISSITTQYSTSLGFFSWTNKVLMEGLCKK